MPYSSGTGAVTQIAGFISGKTVSLSMSGRRGYSPGGSESHGGPDHHNLLSISPLGAIPLEAKSAGLLLVSTYLQLYTGIFLRMFATLCEAYTLRRLGEVLSHPVQLRSQSMHIQIPWAHRGL